MYKKYKGKVPTDARKLASQQTGLTPTQITRSIALIKKKKEDEENYRMQSYPVSTALFQVRLKEKAFQDPKLLNSSGESV